MDTCYLAPRLGTTKGAKTRLSTPPSDSSLAAQETGLNDFERDRRAVIAMTTP